MALTERLAILIEANAGNAIAEFKKVGAAAKGLEGQAAAGAKGLGGLGQAGQVVGNLLKAGIVAGAAGAGAAIAKFATDGVNEFVQLASEVKRFKAIAGGTAESASLLLAAFKAVGVDADTAAGGVFQLEKRLTTNAKALAEFGVAAVKDAKGNTDMTATLLSVGDAFKATHDPAQRATLLTAAFGRQGTALVPLLGKTREQIEQLYAAAERHHEVFSQEDLDKATEFKLATHDLSEAFTGLEREVGSGLLPVLTGLAQGLTAAIDKAEEFNKKTHGMIGQILDIASGPLGLLTEGLKLFGDGNDAAAVAADEAVTAMEGEAKAADTLEKSLFSLESAHRSVDSAVRSEAAAERDLGEKKKTLNTLLKEGAVDLKAVAQAHKDVAAAERELASARNAQTDAAAAVHDAEQALADLRSGAAAAKNMVDHADDVGKAQLGVTRATKRLNDAQDNLVKLQRSGTATSRDLSDAQDEVTQATYDLHDANANLIATQDTVNKLFQVGSENSPEVVAAVGTVTGAHATLADATQHVADATQDVSDKQAALGTALAGDPNYDDKVRQARQNVADATQHVADAMYNVAAAKAKFEDAKGLVEQTVGAGGPAAVDNVRNSIQTLLNKKPELALFFDPVLADLREAAGIADSLINKFAPGTIGAALAAPGGFLVGNAISVATHASGGIATRPSLGVFGEAGPEALVPLPSNWQNSFLGVGRTTAAAGQRAINIYVSGALDSAGVASQIHKYLLQHQRRNGGSLGFN